MFDKDVWVSASMETAGLCSPFGVVLAPATTAVVVVNLCPCVCVTVPRVDGRGELDSSDSRQYTTPV